LIEKIRGAQVQLSFKIDELFEKFSSLNGTVRTVSFERAELLEQFSSERTELIEQFFLSELNFWNSSAQSELNWLNSSCERTELFKQFAQNELNELNSSYERTELFKQFGEIVSVNCLNMEKHAIKIGFTTQRIRIGVNISIFCS
jgi:hypothetical protein